MTILLIEDNKGIAKGLAFSLQSAGYETVLCHSCEQAYRKIGGDYAVIIIDISLPDGNGFALYQDIRRVNQAPVIFLTALDDEDSIVKGFDLGAEDYITKPFSTRELIARVKRLTRRSKSTVTVGEITLDLDKQAVFKGGEKVELTALEYRICSLLMQNHGAVVTREMIFEKIWDIAGNYVNDNTLSVYIRRIRQKLGTASLCLRQSSPPAARCVRQAPLCRCVTCAKAKTRLWRS